MKFKNSSYIRPINILIDLLVFILIVYVIGDTNYYNIYFISYSLIIWLTIAYYTRFYIVHRYTHISKVITKSLTQFIIFSLAYFSYFAIFKEGQIIANQKITLSIFIFSVTFLKFFIFFLLKKYRAKGKNFRNIILFGNSASAKKLSDLFHSKNDLGYRFYGFFSDTIYKSKKYLGSFNDGFSYINDKDIDEVYCDPSHITSEQLLKIRRFVKRNNLDIRLIPENKAIYSKGRKLCACGSHAHDPISD